MTADLGQSKHDQTLIRSHPRTSIIGNDAPENLWGEGCSPCERSEQVGEQCEGEWASLLTLNPPHPLVSSPSGERRNFVRLIPALHIALTLRPTSST